MHREGIFEKHRVESAAIVGATLAALVQGEAIFGPVPQGYAWYVENCAHLLKGLAHNVSTTWATTPDDTRLGGVGGIAAYDGQGLIGSLNGTIAGDFIPAGDGFYIGPGHALHVVASAAFGASFAVGDLCTVTAQIAVHQLDPMLGIMSPEDRRQVAAAMPHLPGASSPVTASATAGSRATDGPPIPVTIEGETGKGQARFDQGDSEIWGEKS